MYRFYNMKKIIALAIVTSVFALSCAPQKTCPTYLKNTNKVDLLKKV